MEHPTMTADGSLISRATSHRRIATSGSIDRVAASNSFSRKHHDEVAWPARRLVDRVVRAEQLGAASDHGVANRSVVGPRLLGIGVSTGTNEIALLDKCRDLGGRPFVGLDESGIRLSRRRGGQDDASTQ